ncbi:MAG: thioredoxin domain-containing protein [Gemmatimonadota bacterium]|jgi:protein-disulfide isomerase
MNRTYASAGALLTLTLSLAACGGGEAAMEPVEMEGLDDPNTVVEMARGMVLGPEDAAITIHEFGDYQCPGCGQFAALVKPQIEQGLVSRGNVRFVFYDYPLVTIHPYAFVAARASRCAADQERYWEYHEALFRNQSTWATSSSAPLGLFEDYAGELGLDEGAFSECLRSDRHADVVTANMRLGDMLGVTGTPSVMVSEGGNARRLSDTSYQGIATTVEDILAELSGGEDEPGDAGDP